MSSRSRYIFLRIVKCERWFNLDVVVDAYACVLVGGRERERERERESYLKLIRNVIFWHKIWYSASTYINHCRVVSIWFGLVKTLLVGNKLYIVQI